MKRLLAPLLAGAAVFALSLGVGRDRVSHASGLLSWPTTGGPQVTSWFDHDRPGSGMGGASYLPFVRYDGYRDPEVPIDDPNTNSLCTSATTCYCTAGFNCYNGHQGIDISTGGLSGQPIIAAAPGIVSGAPGNTGDGFGIKVRLWHETSAVATMYAHLQSYLVQQNQFVNRGQIIGYSGCTGTCFGAHLHFGVYNAQTGGNHIDPYGWSGGGSDPWGVDIGWLWSTYPPSSAPAYGIPILPGDYNGNGSEDTGVWRPNACCGSPDPGMWHIYQQFSAQWGLPTDIPVPGDWDSDSSDDVAVYRPSTGYWYFKDANLICGSAGCGVQWGVPGDIPVPGDYNGDGKDEVVVWRSAPRPDLGQPEGGYWLFRAGGQQQWGRPEDFPVPGDYDADPNTDIAVWRPLPYGVYSEGMWWFKQTNSICGFSSPCGVQWGTGSDIPLPGVFSGDIKDDVVVWRPSNGYWYFKQQNYVCGNPGCGVQWGASTDIPVPFDSNCDQFDEVINWRPSTGVWWFRGPIAPCGPATPCGVQWGTAGDIPLAGRLRR